MMARNFKELRDEVRSDPARAARVERHRKELERELTLADLRRARDLTQVQLAKALDTTQSGVSRIEHNTDVYLSTLRSYIEALGGRLELHVVFPDDHLVLKNLAELEENRADGKTPLTA